MLLWLARRKTLLSGFFPRIRPPEKMDGGSMFCSVMEPWTGLLYSTDTKKIQVTILTKLALGGGIRVFCSLLKYDAVLTLVSWLAITHNIVVWSCKKTVDCGVWSSVEFESRARICSPGIDSARLWSLLGRYKKKVCRTGPPGWESTPGLL